MIHQQILEYAIAVVTLVRAVMSYSDEKGDVSTLLNKSKFREKSEKPKVLYYLYHSKAEMIR